MTRKEKHYIYGTFDNVECCQKALKKLEKEGFTGALIVKNEESDIQLTPVELKTEQERFFKIAGCIGAVIGGLAGAIASPTLNMPDTFQILTPAMAAVASAAVGGYIGMMICAFLNSNNKNALIMEIFDGRIAHGSSLVAVPITTPEQKMSSFKCLDSCDPTAIVFNTGKIGPLDLETPSESSTIAKVA